MFEITEFEIARFHCIALPRSQRLLLKLFCDQCPNASIASCVFKIKVYTNDYNFLLAFSFLDLWHQVSIRQSYRIANTLQTRPRVWLCPCSFHGSWQNYPNYFTGSCISQVSILILNIPQCLFFIFYFFILLCFTSWLRTLGYQEAMKNLWI